MLDKCPTSLFACGYPILPWSKKRQRTPVFLTEKFHGRRSLVAHSPWGSQRIRHDWVAKHAHTSCFLSATCWKDCPFLTHFSQSCNNHLTTHVKLISGLSVLSDGIYACIYANHVVLITANCSKFCNQGLWVLFFLILLFLQKVSLEFLRRLCWICRSLCIIDIWIILSLPIHEHGNRFQLFLCFFFKFL